MVIFWGFFCLFFAKKHVYVEYDFVSNFHFLLFFETPLQKIRNFKKKVKIFAKKRSGYLRGICSKYFFFVFFFTQLIKDKGIEKKVEKNWKFSFFVFFHFFIFFVNIHCWIVKMKFFTITFFWVFLGFFCLNFLYDFWLFFN